MSTAIENLFTKIDESVASMEGAKLSAEYIEATKAIGQAVESWANEMHLVDPKDVNGVQVCYAAESYDTTMLGSVLGADQILDLCKKAHVANEHLAAAGKRVAALLAQTLGKGEGNAFKGYITRKPTDKVMLSVESLYPADLVRRLGGSQSLETFGINMDRVEPDLKTILTIALLQFHMNLTPRIVPVQTVTQGNVTIVRENLQVFDMAKDEREPTRVIELYRDPSLVSVAAQRIKPLMGASNKNAKFLVADDIYKFAQKIDMFELALTDKPGYDKYNHTDFVEDNICLDGVLVKIENSDETGKAFYRMIPIPTSRGHFTQVSQDAKSTIRRLWLDRYPVRVIASDAADTKSGLTSDAAVTAALTGGVGLSIDLHIDANVDRQTSLLQSGAWIGDLAIKGGTMSDADRAALLAKFTVTPVGFTLDARYNEDNKRKTSIRAEVVRRSMSYELPTGRNFVVDAAIGQDGVTNSAAYLAQLEHIGRDHNNLKIIEGTLKAVHDENISMNNDKEVRDSLANQYAAGDLVNPFVYMDTLDMSGMYGIRSADASGDIKQFVKQYFNRLTSALLAKTYFDKQLSENATVTFRVITSGTLLGDLFKMRHIHQHLEGDKPGTGGVEHVMPLDNGVVLEFVTTTFEVMTNKIILIPYLANAQTSVLNFGTDFDQGTLVGAISYAAENSSAFHRTFSVTRELLIPTNVMGAVIEVSGYTGITMNDSTSSLTVVGVTETAPNS